MGRPWSWCVARGARTVCCFWPRAPGTCSPGTTTAGRSAGRSRALRPVWPTGRRHDLSCVALHAAPVWITPCARMAEKIIVAIDQGTTGTTVLVLDVRARVLGRATVQVSQHYPGPGW